MIEIFCIYLLFFFLKNVSLIVYYVSGKIYRSCNDNNLQDKIINEVQNESGKSRTIAA